MCCRITSFSSVQVAYQQHRNCHLNILVPSISANTNPQFVCLLEVWCARVLCFGRPTDPQRGERSAVLLYKSVSLEICTKSAMTSKVRLVCTKSRAAKPLAPRLLCCLTCVHLSRYCAARTSRLLHDILGSTMIKSRELYCTVQVHNSVNMTFCATTKSNYEDRIVVGICNTLSAKHVLAHRTMLHGANCGWLCFTTRMFVRQPLREEWTHTCQRRLYGNSEYIACYYTG